MAAKRKIANDYVCYSMKILDFAIGYDVRQGEDEEQQEHFHFDLEVELDEPKKGVSRGSLTVYGTIDGGGGSLNYDSDKQLHGCLWVGLAGATALSSLLTAGNIPHLHLWGTSFFRRDARIRDVSWYTPGHPELAEPDLD